MGTDSHQTDDAQSTTNEASETLHNALDSAIEDHYSHYELTDDEQTWLHDALDTAAADEPNAPSNKDSSYIAEDDGHVITLGDRDIFREYVENPPETNKEYPLEVKTAVNILQSAHGHAADEITGDDLSSYDDVYVFTVENGGNDE